MKVVKKGDGLTGTSINVNELTATVDHVTVHDSLDDGRGFQHHTTLDFSECSQEQILRLAADAAIIKARVKYAMKSCDPTKMTNRVNVADMLKGERTKVSKVDRKVAELAKATGFDAAKIADLLKNLS